jgi:molybdopterin/thiamine biosynthesis adenylyltransferase
MTDFDYATFTQRNIGFVTASEQRTLRDGAVFVCGVGGMGGACVTALARSGVGRIAIADFDRFEVSNLNRQLFANLDTIGTEKTDAVATALRKINPEIQLTVYGREWTDRLASILPSHPIVVNAMDDLASGIELYREARRLGATVIDAYLSPLPSVTVVRPTDPRPEERLGYPTVGKAWRDITPDDRTGAMAREIEYVVTHSSSLRYVDATVAAQVIAGTRSRMSFAPMVITTGCLMAFEAVNLLMGRESAADYRGFFFDPWRARVERPRSAPIAWLIGSFARRKLRELRELTNAG